MSKVMWGEGTPWKTEAAFWSWIRSGLRGAVWKKHPVKLNKIKEVRVKAPLGRKTKNNPDGMVWAAKCAQCGSVTRQTNCEVDHLIPSGSLRCVTDIAPFVERLAFVSSDELEIVCKPCHKIRSYAERAGVSFEEAAAKKKAISFKTKADQVRFLKDNGLDIPTNSKGRLELIERYLREQDD